MLERDEEFMLAKRWVEHQDSAAAEKMVTSHLRLVDVVDSSRYSGICAALLVACKDGHHRRSEKVVF